jgi:hypothetical protein
LTDRIRNQLEGSAELDRYQKSRAVSDSRQAVFSSWIHDNKYVCSSVTLTRIIDLLVQSYAPQPNLLRRSASPFDTLAPITDAQIASLADKVNDWDFHAGEMNHEDLIWCAVLIFEHILETSGDELSRFKITRGKHS